jgi:hypothetical protein
MRFGVDQVLQIGLKQSAGPGSCSKRIVGAWSPQNHQDRWPLPIDRVLVQFVRQTHLGSAGFDKVQVSEVALVQLFDHEAEQLFGRAIVDAAILTEG